MTTTAATIVANVRRLSSLFNNNLFSDAQIVTLFNDGASELYDWMVGQFETWFLTFVDFSLSGGVGQNTFAMPMDKLLKDNTLEKNPTSNNPINVPRLSSWSDRNSFPGIGYGGIGGQGGCGIRYYPAGSNLMIFPPNSASGNFRLWYTPKYIPIALNTIPPAVAGTPAVFTAFGAAGSMTFTGGGFTQANIGDTVTVTGATSSANNGSFTILIVTDGNNITTSNLSSVSELAFSSVVVVQPQGTTNAFNVVMEPWVLYPEIHAAVQIRTSRQQDSADLVGKLAALKQRIESATANRTEEVGQSPLRDNPGYPYGYGW